MQLLLIVIPCVIIGTALVAVLDRTGLLPGLDRPGPAARKPVNSMARPLSLGAIVILAAWILAWFVVLAVGLNIILSAN